MMKAVIWLQLHVPSFSGSEAEYEVNLPVFFIHCINEALSMWVSYAETHMFQLVEHMECWDEIKGPMFEDDTMLKNEKEARYALVLNAKILFKVKLEKQADMNTKFGSNLVEESQKSYLRD